MYGERRLELAGLALLCYDRDEESLPTRWHLCSYQSNRQRASPRCPADRTIFLEGIAGTGKTTAAVARLEHLLRSGVPGGDILIVLPQRTLAAPYNAAPPQGPRRLRAARSRS